MVKRSFTKQSELKNKDIVPSSAIGREFNAFGLTNNTHLTTTGRRVIDLFVKNNQTKMDVIKEKEEEMYKLKHSKPGVQWNDWKPFNHQIEEFSRTPVDDVHSFKKERKKKFLVEDPFRVPKKNGDYFEKDIKII